MTSDLTAREEDLLRQLLTHAVAAHDGVDNPAEPYDCWYRLGQRNAHAYAAGLLVAGPGDNVRADAIADRVTILLSDTLPALTVDDLYAAVLAPFPPGSAHPDTASLRWLEPRAFAAAWPRHPGVLEDTYGSTWGARHDTVIHWRHHPDATDGILFAHDLTWDEYAVLAAVVEARDVETAYRAACRSDPPVTPETFTSLLPRRASQPNLDQPPTRATVRRLRHTAVDRPEPTPAAPELGLSR